jgi:cell division FtsZ-interacting protein ZapD
VHAPELDRTIDAILQKMPLVEQGARHAERIGQIAEDLDGQVSVVTERLEVPGVVQDRLDTLHSVPTDVESKLARRNELDTLQAQCDSVATQMLDTQQKIGSGAARQGKILRMETRLTIMQDRLDQTAKQVKEVQRDEATLAEQDARLTN